MRELVSSQATKELVSSQATKELVSSQATRELVSSQATKWTSLIPGHNELIPKELQYNLQ